MVDDVVVDAVDAVDDDKEEDEEEEEDAVLGLLFTCIAVDCSVICNASRH